MKEAIAAEFFGEDAYDTLSARVRLVKPDLMEFVSKLLSCLWNQVRKATKDQLDRLEEEKVEAMGEYESE